MSTKAAKFHSVAALAPKKSLGTHIKIFSSSLPKKKNQRSVSFSCRPYFLREYRCHSVEIDNSTSRSRSFSFSSSSTEEKKENSHSVNLPVDRSHIEQSVMLAPFSGSLSSRLG